jgi:hypothetical protein
VYNKSVLDYLQESASEENSVDNKSIDNTDNKSVDKKDNNEVDNKSSLDHISEDDEKEASPVEAFESKA